MYSNDDDDDDYFNTCLLKYKLNSTVVNYEAKAKTQIQSKYFANIQRRNKETNTKQTGQKQYNKTR
jgi:hypothetical protein